MKHAMIAYNPWQADKYEAVDFQRCCVFRTVNPVGPELQNGSIAVIYRTGAKRLVGEFEVIRVDQIEKPQSEEGREIYRKAFGYPVTLYDGEYYGPTHIFYRNLRVYSPEVPFSDFMEYRNGRKIPTMIPISHIWLDDKDLEFIRGKTAVVSVSGIQASTFIDPYGI